MADISIRSDGIDVEQIMRQIRARIREKRGADYTEEEIHRLASAKLETFLDASRVRSDLLEAFRSFRAGEPPPNFVFEDETLFDTHRSLLRLIRRLLRPVLKLFFNPAPLSDALHLQAKLNANIARTETLYYELIHNLVLETTRLGIEVRNMKMRVESMASRLDFDERRARALEGAVQYRPGALQVKPLSDRRPDVAPGVSEPTRGAQPGRTAAEGDQDGGPERRKRRRRRGRRRGPGSAGGPGAPEGASAAGDTTATADFAGSDRSSQAEVPAPNDDEPSGGPDETP
jgi:hypothetical protein